MNELSVMKGGGIFYMIKFFTQKFLNIIVDDSENILGCSMLILNYSP